MSITHLTDEQIIENLSSLQKDFFEAVSDGPEAATDFACRFARLGEITVKRTQSLSPTESDLLVAPALTAAMTISAVASSLHDVTGFADELSTELRTDLLGLFDNLSLSSDPMYNPKSSLISLSAIEPFGSSSHALSPDPRQETIKFPASPEPDVPLLPHQIRVYRWLRKHLHNPYPSTETKRRIAEKFSVVPKVVGEWFSQARRRIGWNTILKGRFRGNRQLCVDCAHRIFVDDSGPSAYNDEIIKDFFSMKFRLEELQDRAEYNGIVKHGADSGSVPTTYTDNLTTKKRRRVSNEDELQQSCLAFERHEYSAALPHRPKKRMRESNPTVLHPLSRTVSLSASFSSRSSTTELSTPISHTLPLPVPILDFDDSIEKWVSSLSTESVEDQFNTLQHSKKRFISDYDDSYGPAKRIRLSDPGVPWITSGSPLHSSTTESETLALYDHFDFSLPPAASVDANLIVGEPLHINSFDYAKWGINKADEGILSEPDIEHLSVMKGNAVYIPADVRGDMTTEFVDVTETIDLSNNHSNKQVEHYTHVAHLTALEGLNPGTPIQGPNSIPGKETMFSPPPVSAIDGSLERLMKLTRINYLLAEAAQLQSEVFS